MKTLNDYIINEYVDDLGNEFDLGDWIQFDSKNLTIMGEVTVVNDDKYEVKPFGFRYDPKLSDEKVDKIKSSLKSSYKLSTKRKVYKLSKPEGKEDFRYFK